MASEIGDGSCTAKAVREGQITGELDHLNGSVSKLSLLVERLEDKLSLVVTCDPPCTSDECPQDVLVPMADTVRMQRKTVDSISERMGSLIDRIEI